MPRLKAGRAFWAGLFGFGYVYVGRIGIAFALVGASFVLTAVFSWARWILDPIGIYLLSGSLLALLVLGIAHPVLIAKNQPEISRKRYNRWWFYGIWLVVGSLATNAIIANRAMLLGYETFRVPAASMAPTLVQRDFIMVNSWRYRNETPRPGDIVVYEADAGSGVRYVKRIVATPGDEVEVRQGRLLRNGELASEDYLDPSLRVGGRDFGPIQLSRDEYFVLGDNRANSRDSRYHGPVPLSMISGRVESIWLSMSGFDRFPAQLQGGT